MSDEYTPSTDELIARARQQTRGITDPSMRERLIIDLADALESVRADERERIAQAIIERTSGYYSMSGPPEDRRQYYLGINHAARIAREGA